MKKILFFCLISLISFGTLAKGQPWIGAWNNSVTNFTSFKGYLGINNDFQNQTIRNEVTSSFDGKTVRIKLSNEFGLEDLEIGSATIFVKGNKKVGQLKFNKNKFITIPKGEFVWSDPINFKIKSLDKVNISLYIKNKVTAVTGSFSSGNSVSSIEGDFTLDQNFNKANKPGGYSSVTLFFTSMEILGDKKDGTILAFGDSITTLSWPDHLAKELLNNKINNLSVIREAELMGAFGIAGIKRFEKAILSHSNVKSVIVLEGINDIIHSEPGMFKPSKVVTSSEIIDGLKEYISLAHKNNIKIYGATIMPFKGFEQYTDKGDKIRQEVNLWIRTQSNYDGIFDFDMATRDKEDNSKLDSKLDSGDHLHPSDAGGEIMAKTVDLNLLTK